jgi:hypothetical protein
MGLPRPTCIVAAIPEGHAGSVQKLCREQNDEFRQGVYSVAVVVWLMADTGAGQRSGLLAEGIANRQG